MKTVLRVPIYLMVDTEVTDRATVTRLMQNKIIPEIIKSFVSTGNKHLVFSKEEIEFIQKNFGSFSYKFLTDVEALESR